MMNSDLLETFRQLLAQHCTDKMTCAALAKRIGVSVFHLQRQFKLHYGITPKQYQAACRLVQFKQNLRQQPDVTTAIYSAGFGSSSRVYEGLQSTLGMTPRQYQKGGAGLVISYAFGTTTMGLLLLGATDKGLCFVQFGASKTQLLERLAQEYPHAQRQAMFQPSPLFDEWMRALNAYLAGGTLPTLPLDVSGTPFQIKVWQYLQSIPAGTQQTYSQVAQAIGHSKAVRATASACAANTVALLIPCHRVLRSDGGLGGYRWGLVRKQKLLALEQGLYELALNSSDRE